MKPGWKWFHRRVGVVCNPVGHYRNAGLLLATNATTMLAATSRSALSSYSSLATHMRDIQTFLSEKKIRKRKNAHGNGYVVAPKQYIRGHYNRCCMSSPSTCAALDLDQRIRTSGRLQKRYCASWCLWTSRAFVNCQRVFVFLRIHTNSPFVISSAIFCTISS